MANKPEIQYVGQFYIHGSEAKKLAEKKEQKQARTELPQHRIERVRQVHVDPLAIASLCIAAVMMVTMVMGTLSLQTAWQELKTAEKYVYQLQDTNRVLATQYRAGYDLNEIRSAAIALGMVPVEEVQHMTLNVIVPVQQPEPTWLENVVWFLEGLFA